MENTTIDGGVLYSSNIESQEKGFFENKGIYAFMYVCLSYLFLLFVKENWIITDEIYYNTFGEQITNERITEMLAIKNEWSWIAYPIIPLILFIQSLFAAFTLNVGALLFDYKISFGKLYKITINAMIVFGGFALLQTCILYFVEVRHMDDLAKYDFYSLLYFTKPYLPEYLWYPVGLINIAEILFVLLLTLGVKQKLKISFLRSLTFTSLSYGVGVSIWVLVIVFIHINA